MKKRVAAAAVLLGMLLSLFFPGQRVLARDYDEAKYDKNRWTLMQEDYRARGIDRLIFVKYKSGTRATVEMWKKVKTTVWVPKTQKTVSAPQKETEEALVLAAQSAGGDQVDAVRASGMRKKTIATWKKIVSHNAFVGRNGIYKEREGDKKTPVGAFRVTMAFGIKKSPGTAGIAYTRLNQYHYWSGEKDTYNTFVDARTLGRTWMAGEHLITYDPFYNYALAFDFNKDGVYKKGSAIFLHCTKPYRKYTAGCIAITEKYMQKIVQNTTKHTMIFIYPD